MSQTGKTRRPDFAAEISVGKLVQFESRERAGNTVKQPVTAEAEILIFTGVRYERQTGVGNSPDKPSASSGGKRKRG
jgi:hypothetical protein